MAATLLVFGFDTPSTASAKHLWFVCMLCILGYRFMDALFWQFRLRHSDFDGVSAIRRFVVGSLSTAFLWSCYAVFMFHYMSNDELALTLIILGALAGGASTVLAGHKNTATAFVLLILCPVGAIALFSPSPYHNMIGGLALMLSGILGLAARRSASYTTDTIKLRNEHGALMEQIRQEKADIDRVNQELSEANKRLNIAHDSLEAEVNRRTEKISLLSSRDPLTGLFNRSAFTQQLAMLLTRSQERGHSLALLFIDLNGFKKINDTLGHRIGDGVLVEVSKRIEAFANDYPAGRWGGDEFLIALPYADQATAMSVATALQTRVAQTIDIEANQLNLTASVGIAMSPEHSVEELELIQLADFAMFEQKKSGRVEPRIFSHDLYLNLKHVQDLRDGLQQAINQRQLYLCYQPILDSNSLKPWAFEALLRWDFNGQFISPDVFIPLAEQSGFIKDIGAWVLNRACIDASQWQGVDDASVSVNVSVIQLMDEGFISTLDRALVTSGLPPQRLHIEITESIFADNKKKIRAQLDAIKQRNIQVSIDDFGTGYSSLSQLQTLNVDTVKIDKTFVQNMADGGEAIIRATLFIAQEFGSQTVAEGIETEADADNMRALGVNYLQGFLYAKPMKNTELAAWISQHNSNQRQRA
ncbi:bifunctional diguanylate cyclase/phosphodiesterase [Aestuariibacter halophilus]|uniref:Bifunctional diguanylate cyclase/phosphodiesterase n=1 Tax=Fluctibacter halophilus TaxID=226011 RepID=A0ABS8GC61_9ALTE|nr:bifunctional diguanylate cyclase/phosphodiesterase [Aestuariibacter halophilus]MCC2618083.1 bifunctional diguanylate cyclase/phosphodiesterase [Aestuariibacter halophilus]